jgi:hypothetical protein
MNFKELKENLKQAISMIFILKKFKADDGKARPLILWLEKHGWEMVKTQSTPLFLHPKIDCAVRPEDAILTQLEWEVEDMP